MGRCRICGYESKELSSSLGICRECLRKDHSLANKIGIHKSWRIKLGLPPTPPKDDNGVKCPICINECKIGDGGIGFCGVITNRNGKLMNIAGVDNSVLHYYLDPLPTNCVADPVCPASTSRGYPKYTRFIGAEYGYYNLAVFYAGCDLNCLFCQNIEHKYLISGFHIGRYAEYKVSIDKLYETALDKRVSCVCYFGGDPTPNIIYSIKLSKRILKYSKESNDIKRICWETNGLVNPVFMKSMTLLSKESGGIVKIDWKAWTPSIYQALTGVDGYKAVKRLKENVKLVYEIGYDRGDPPILVVSILIVPHYIDYYEVYGIASYISNVSSDIPIVLLAFHPHHLMNDIPTTSWSQMNQAIQAVKDAGIKEFYIGNKWLLRPE